MIGDSPSISDEILDTAHVVVVLTYIERWPRRDQAPESMPIVVAEPDEQIRARCPRCRQRGQVAQPDVRRWRTLDLLGKRCLLASEVPRIITGDAREGHRPGAAGAA